MHTALEQRANACHLSTNSCGHRTIVTSKVLMQNDSDARSNLHMIRMHMQHSSRDVLKLVNVLKWRKDGQEKMQKS